MICKKGVLWAEISLDCTLDLAVVATLELSMGCTLDPKCFGCIVSDSVASWA